MSPCIFHIPIRGSIEITISQDNYNRSALVITAPHLFTISPQGDCSSCLRLCNPSYPHSEIHRGHKIDPTDPLFSPYPSRDQVSPGDLEHLLLPISPPGISHSRDPWPARFPHIPHRGSPAGETSTPACCVCRRSFPSYPEGDLAVPDPVSITDPVFVSPPGIRDTECGFPRRAGRCRPGRRRIPAHWSRGRGYATSHVKSGTATA